MNSWRKLYVGKLHILYSLHSTMRLNEGRCTWEMRTYRYADSSHCK